MAFSIAFDKAAAKAFAKLPREVQRDITRFLEKKLMPAANPRLYGKPLSGKLRGLWRYRVADYRIICQIKDQQLTILVLDVGHRKHVYH